MLLADAPLTFREFMTNEPLPLAAIFHRVFLFLKTRPDAVLFGAHAVNAYCEPERMTHDIDVLSTHAAAFADDLRADLTASFQIAVRVREVGDGFRVYQVRKPKNRHLVDVRQVAVLPAHQDMEGVRTVSPLDLIAMKTLSMSDRRGREKGLSDRLDLHRLLRAFPTMREENGTVAARLRAMGAPEQTLAAWRELVDEPIAPEDTDDSDL